MSEKRSALRALANAIEDIQWMSAASDFAPDGKAHKGWVKVRTRLARYEAALAQAVDELPAWNDKPSALSSGRDGRKT